jgi:uncharacterized sulfatase
MRALLVSMLLVGPLHGQDRPNVLWISSEDNGPDLGCYDCPDAQTPHLDALASAGVTYTRAWSNAPVCSTARTTIIMGCYPQTLGAEHHRSRVRLPESHRPFPALLREAGYHCSNNAKTDYNLEQPGRIWDQSSGQAHWRTRTAGQPFFAVFNLGISHESQIRRRPHEFVHDPAEVRIPPQHPDTRETREGWAQYHDQLTAMDRKAGRILDELDADGLADDTILFYWGDHGAGLPGFKRNAKNQGLHVPLLVRVPPRWRDHAGAPAAGARSDRLVAFVDLGPTVLSLAGIPTPVWMDGIAFLGPHAGPPKQHLLGYRGRMDERDDLVRTLTDGRYVYVRNFLPWLPLGQHVAYMFETPTTQAWKRLFDAGELDEVQAAFWRPRRAEELYDLAADPQETANLAGSAEHRDILVRMREELRARIAAMRDLSFAPEAHLVATAEDGPPWLLAHGDTDPTAAWLDAAWRASAGEPTAEAQLATDAVHADPVVRTWGLRGLAHLDATARQPALFNDALGDPDPSVRVIAAEALLALDAERTAARDVLVALADRRNAGFFVALAAWNAIDRLGPRLAAVHEALASIPADFEDLPAHARSYLPRLREHALARTAGR